METRRSAEKFDCTIDTAAASCTELPMKGNAEGTLVVPAAATGLTAVTIHGSHELGGTYYPLSDEDGNAAEMTVAHTNMYRLPVEITACAAIKIVGNAKAEGCTVYFKS